MQGPKGMQASNVTGPQGVSVQGDPRAQRQYYPKWVVYISNFILCIHDIMLCSPHAYRNNNNNRGGAPGGSYNGGGKWDDLGWYNKKK